MQERSPMDEAEHAQGQDGEQAMPTVQARQEQGGQEARPNVNANAPVKTMTMGAVSTDEVVWVRSGQAQATVGQRVVAEGRCPGQGCTEVIRVSHPGTIAQLVEQAITKLGDLACKRCGQRIEAWPRRIAVVR